MNDILGRLYFNQKIEVKTNFQHMFHRYFQVTEVFEVSRDTVNVCVREISSVKRFLKKDTLKFNDVLNKKVKESVYYTKPISNDYLSDQVFNVLINKKEFCSFFTLNDAIFEQVPSGNEPDNAIEFCNVYQKII